MSKNYSSVRAFPVMTDMESRRKEAFEFHFSKVSAKEGWHKLSSADFASKKKQFEAFCNQEFAIGRSLELQRIKSIAALMESAPQHKDMIERALYTPGETAQNVAVRIIKIEKSRGLR